MKKFIYFLLVSFFFGAFSSSVFAYTPPVHFPLDPIIQKNGQIGTVSNASLDDYSGPFPIIIALSRRMRHSFIKCTILPSSPLPPGVAAFIPQSVTNCHIYGIAIGSENNVLFLAGVILSIIALLFLLTIIFAIVCCYRKYGYKIRPYLKRGLIVLVGIVVLAVIIYVPKSLWMSLILSVKEVTVGQIATNTSPQQATEDILYNSWGPYDYNKNGAVDQNQEDAIQSDIIIDGKFNMNLDYSVYGGRGSSGLDSVVAENLVSLGVDEQTYLQSIIGVTCVAGLDCIRPDHIGPYKPLSYFLSNRQIDFSVSINTSPYYGYMLAITKPGMVNDQNGMGAYIIYQRQFDEIIEQKCSSQEIINFGGEGGALGGPNIKCGTFIHEDGTVLIYGINQSLPFEGSIPGFYQVVYMLKNNAFVFLHSSSIEIPQIKEQVYPLVTETTYTDGKALAHISNLVDTIVQNDVANPNGVLNQEFSKLSEIVTSMSLVY